MTETKAGPTPDDADGTDEGPSATPGRADTVTEGDAADGAAPGNEVTTASPSDRLAMWLFVFAVAATAPLILFHFGAYHWFFRDDFNFIADRQSGIPDLLEPNGGAHWVALPRLIYFALWQVFGMRTYVPYQACVVAYHLAVVVLLRVVMRRAGVGPWLASAAAAVMLLFGPGAQNIVWAFQVGFTGSIAWGLAHLLLTDHDGGLDRRDALGLLAGLLAIGSSGVGVTTTAVVGLAVLLRRGWRPALLHTIPLGVIYYGWTQVADAESTSIGAPTARQLWDWLADSVVGTFMAIGHFQVLAWGLLVILVVGAVLIVGSAREGDRTEIRQRLAIPVALAVGSIQFAAMTGWGRWWTMGAGARSSRYIYLTAAFTLPLLAVAAQAIARRWRPLTPALVAVFLIPIPFNVSSFDPQIFNEAYMQNREHVLTTAVRMPFASDVPPDVQPIPDPFASDAVTIGFLLHAVRTGDLEPSTTPIGPTVVNEFRVRLGVASRPGHVLRLDCRLVSEPFILDTEQGDTFRITGPVRIATARDGQRSGPLVDFPGDRTRNELTVELPDLELWIAPRPPGSPPSQLCR